MDALPQRYARTPISETPSRKPSGFETGQFPAIPRNDADLTPPKHLQAIANTAGFHFAFIEQGGTSLYPSLAQRVTDTGGLANPAQYRAHRSNALSDVARQSRQRTSPDRPHQRLVFPDLNSPPFGGERFQTNLIMPEPTIFLSRTFPIVSIVRPTETQTELQWLRSIP